MNQPLPLESAAIAKPKRQSTFSVWIPAMLASGLLLGTLVGGINVYNGNGFPALYHHGDVLTQQEVNRRSKLFNALQPLPLEIVQEQDIGKAIDSLALSASTQEALLSDMAKPAVKDLPAPASQSLRLAWVTLWDTDAEDGDTVQLDSQGYSRTVVLTKAPVTFAVPVPADGVIHVTGIRDGEGGGITVGLASGASKAVFPIMSENQSLGLKVKITP